jgi:hypothetical protein
MQVNIGLRVLTRPIPARLPELYRTLGTNYDERVLPSIIQVCLPPSQPPLPPAFILQLEFETDSCGSVTRTRS